MAGSDDVPRPGRKRPVHLPIREKPGDPVIVFVTVNTVCRRQILANEEAARTILDAWKAADAWIVGRYVVMPDHVHLFCAPRDESVELKTWVAYWKWIASRSWPRRNEFPVWQRDFWDTQLRRSDRYAEKWEYVRNNPVRKGLVARPEDWPWGGELNVLAW